MELNSCMHQQQLRVFMYNTASLRKTDYFEIFSAMLSLEESTSYFSLKLLLEKWCDCLTENVEKTAITLIIIIIMIMIVLKHVPFA